MQTFTAPSFDDKILEVVAVFGSMQMAVSRVIKLQHHRIAQVLAGVLEPRRGAWVLGGEAGLAQTHAPETGGHLGCRTLDSGPPSCLPVQSLFSPAVLDL